MYWAGRVSGLSAIFMFGVRVVFLFNFISKYLQNCITKFVFYVIGSHGLKYISKYILPDRLLDFFSVEVTIYCY